MVKVCLNPDCQKPIPNDHNYCDEICLRWHIKIKRQHSSFDPKLKPHPNNRFLVEAITSGANRNNPICPICKKSIDNVEENYFQYHGHRFCSINCYREYKKTEKIEVDNDLPFMRWVQEKKEKGE